MGRKRVFIRSEDAELAVQLARPAWRDSLLAKLRSKRRNWSSSGSGTLASGRCKGMARWWTERDEKADIVLDWLQAALAA